MANELAIPDRAGRANLTVTATLYPRAGGDPLMASMTHAGGGWYVGDAPVGYDAAAAVYDVTFTAGGQTDPLGFGVLRPANATPTENAAAVRTDLAAELARIDVAVSTRATNAGVASAILATPANRLATDENGFVTATRGGPAPEPGAVAATLRLSAGGVPVPDALVWLTATPDGPTVAGALRTDNDGRVTFYLVPERTYYRFAKKPGFNFANPQAFVAYGDVDAD